MSKFFLKSHFGAKGGKYPGVCYDESDQPDANDKKTHDNDPFSLASLPDGSRAGLWDGTAATHNSGIQAFEKYGPDPGITRL